MISRHQDRGQQPSVQAAEGQLWQRGEHSGEEQKYFESTWFSSSSQHLQKAEAQLAYELQAAKTKQRIKDEQMMIKVVERSQEILVQEQEIQRRERELG